MTLLGLGHVPSVSFYRDGLLAIADQISDLQKSLLKAHYAAPHRRVTVPQLASLASVNGGFPVVNLQYGRLGRLFAETTGLQTSLRDDGSPRWWAVWSMGYYSPEGFVWQMHEQTAMAMEELGWVKPGDPCGEISEFAHSGIYFEGSAISILANVYERNSQARMACIDHYGCRCSVCDFNFDEYYGDLGAGFIHVHHLIPLAEIGREYIVDPIHDLRPVCPNCHAMLHRRSPPLTISELKKKVRRSR